MLTGTVIEFLVIRYSVKVTEDHLVSLQIQTSKNDVYVMLEILDNEEVVLSTKGKGHAVLPAFIFQKDDSTRGDCELNLVQILQIVSRFIQFYL